MEIEFTRRPGEVLEKQRSGWYRSRVHLADLGNGARVMGTLQNGLVDQGTVRVVPILVKAPEMVPTP